MNNQIIKFLFIGILNTFVGYIIFSIFYSIFFNEFIALLFAYILGIVFNFKTYSKYVFTSSDKQILINFIIIYISIFLFNSLLLSLLINEFIINTYFSQFIAICLVTPLLYILNKRYVFIKNKEYIK
jgi:putative flippase GtrA